MKTERIDEHRMHAETGIITEAAAGRLNAARAAGGRIVAAADDARRIHPFEGETDIFIRPGHRFRGIDALMTNFHLPRSTLFMLVAALMGTKRSQDLYAHAISQRYRFYSYGDASLLLPDGD